jgi:hypothetical protein
MHSISIKLMDDGNLLAARPSPTLERKDFTGQYTFPSLWEYHHTETLQVKDRWL